MRQLMELASPPQQQQPPQLGSQLVAQNKRKEKARIAARARRSQEASIIMEMANELHITQEKIRRIDKATIVKLAIDYIKAFDILCRFRSCGINNNNSSSSSSNDSSSCRSSSSRNSNQENINTAINHNHSNDNSDQSMPKLSTSSIFAPKTDDMDSYFLMINDSDGRPSFVLKPDNEILDEDDLTHLAPQAGDSSISLEVEPLDGIVLDTSLFNSGSPPMKKAPLVASEISFDDHHHHTIKRNSQSSNETENKQSFRKSTAAFANSNPHSILSVLWRTSSLNKHIITTGILADLYIGVNKQTNGTKIIYQQTFEPNNSSSQASLRLALEEGNGPN